MIIARYAAGVSLAASAISLIAFQNDVIGFALLAVGIAACFWAGVKTARELLIPFICVGILAFLPVSTDVSTSHIFHMGLAMTLLVALPYLYFKFVLKEPFISFALFRGVPRRYWLYLLLITIAGYFIIPWYLVESGVYRNWPSGADTESLIRLFIGTNGLGTWDELFFICTILAILRRHFPFWAANIITACIFVSFLYELGFKAYGPFFTTIFALSQGFMYMKTKSLGFVLAVHLVLDLILFFALINAFHPGMFDWFVT